ncbi:MAG: hypothetical protein ABFS12_12990, partial [Bacteroidota bacterium]
ITRDQAMSSKLVRTKKFILRIFDNYVEISKSSFGEISEMDLFEIWDHLEESLKLPVPVLTTFDKCYTSSPEAQLQYGSFAKKYYSAIAFVDENNTINSEETENNVFLKDVSVEVFSSKENAILWLKKFGSVEQLP